MPFLLEDAIGRRQLPTVPSATMFLLMWQTTKSFDVFFFHPLAGNSFISLTAP